VGMIQHRALLVTCWDREYARKLRRRAKRLLRPLREEMPPARLVTPLVGPCVNGYWSFAIMPCGSKVGWEPYQLHVEAIDELIERVVRDDRADWCEVSFGEFGSKAERGSRSRV
jgi:hypothetical protein